MNPNVRGYLAEMIGTFAVVLLTSGVVCASALPGLQGQPGYSRLVIAIAAGAAWAVALAITVRQSGGFLNPAITITLWVFQRIDSNRALGLIVSQFLGGAFAGLALRGLFFSNERLLVETRLGTPHLNRDAFDPMNSERATVLLGIGIEAVLAFVLTFAVFALIFDPRFRRAAGEQAYRLSYLWLGLLVMVEFLLAFNLTGAGLNPARWLGTAIWETTVDGLAARGPFSDHGPYWIGPVLGSLLAGMLYTYALLPEGTPKGPPQDGMP
jgi:glycerol uptake facilitator-like aquaporin